MFKGRRGAPPVISTGASLKEAEWRDLLMVAPLLGDVSAALDMTGWGGQEFMPGKKTRTSFGLDIST